MFIQASLENSNGGAESSHDDKKPEVFDLVGIGFGPSNLSLSVKLAEENLTTAHQLIRPKAGLFGKNDHSSHSSRSFKACFVESNHCFRWHPGMMIDGSRMQICFLKDLVTLRNPCSPFSFLNYLHCHERLIDFINCATFTPTRLEFSDYLAWVARQVVSSLPPPSSSQTETICGDTHNAISLCYGERVVSVEGVLGTSGDINFLRVFSIKSSDGSIQQHLCRNLVISVGGSPRIPRRFEGLLYQPLQKSSYVIHTSTFLRRIDHILSNIVQLASVSTNHHQKQQPLSKPALNRSQSSISLVSSPSSDGPACSPLPTESAFDNQSASERYIKIRIAVVGSGQSAAETLIETYNRLKSSLSHLGPLEHRPEIDLVIKQGHLRPSDDSSFTNQVFDPQATDFFYGLSTKELPTRSKAQAQTRDYRNVKDLLLKEAASTNYAVVNPETLAALYQIIYTQKVREGLEMGQFSNTSQLQDPKINIIKHTDVVSAEPNLSVDGSVNVVLENILTGAQTSSHYNLVILGTGYSRQGWKEILFGGPNEYGSSGLRLADIWPNLSVESQVQPDAEPASEDSPTNSILSSRSSDEDHDSCCMSDTSQKTLNDIKVARNYRLLLPSTFVLRSPAGSSSNKKVTVRRFRPTIWLQGCNESTHGISDTLLSVLAVRSGEIFDGIQKEGWFGNPPDPKCSKSDE